MYILSFQNIVVIQLIAQHFPYFSLHETFFSIELGFFQTLRPKCFHFTQSILWFLLFEHFYKNPVNFRTNVNQLEAEV